MTQKYEYNVAIYKEGMLGSIFLAGGKVDAVKFSGFLNEYAMEGWEVVTVEREMRRMLLIFKREAFLVVLKREKSSNNTKTTISKTTNRV